MPIFDYRCDKCGVVYEKIRSYSDRNTGDVCSCGGSLSRIFTNSTDRDSTITMETVDEYTGKRIQQDINEIMRKRSQKHKQEVEAGAFIEQWGYEEAVKRGYVEEGKKKCL